MNIDYMDFDEMSDESFDEIPKAQDTDPDSDNGEAIDLGSGNGEAIDLGSDNGEAIDLGSGNGDVSDLAAQFEVMKLQMEKMAAERDEALNEREELLNHIVPPRVNLQFDTAHMHTDDEDDEIEAEIESVLVNNLPAFRDFAFNYHDRTNKALSNQWGTVAVYDQSDNLHKRLFHHLVIASRESESLPASDSLNLGWTAKLCAIANVVKGIEFVIPNNGCWLPRENVARDINGRPVVNVSEPSYTTARFICMLFFGTKALDGMHASHICGNSNCVNPDHIVPEPATLNMNREICFKYGSASTCQCVPTCLFLRGGHLLACRSNPELDSCRCEDNCFHEVRKQRRLRDKAIRKAVRDNTPRDVRPITELGYGTNAAGNNCRVFRGQNFRLHKTYANYQTYTTSDNRTRLYADDRYVFITSSS